MKKNSIPKLISFIIALGSICFISNSSAQTPNILINGNSVLASNVSVAPYWLSAGQTLAIGSLVKYISVLEYTIAPATSGGNNLQFENVLSVTTVQTVPTGKAWKIESYALDPSASLFIGDNLGNHVATTDLNMSSKKITNMANPASANDAVNTATLQKGNLIYSTDGGSANSYVVILSPAPASYTAGMIVNFKATNANTGTSTLNVSGLGAVSIKKQVTNNLGVGDIVANQGVSVMYDGTNFQLLSQPGTASVGTTSQVFSATSGCISSKTSLTWGDMYPAAVVAGYSLDKCVPRFLSYDGATGWVYLAISSSSCSGGSVAGNFTPGSSDTWTTIFKTYSPTVYNWFPPNGTNRLADIICFK